jgi:hypothetical protein
VIFYTNFCETFLAVRRTQPNMTTRVLKSSCKALIILVVLIKLGFSGYTFEKCSYIKFVESPSSGSRIVPMRTDRHDEVNSRFSRCCEGAQEVKDLRNTVYSRTEHLRLSTGCPVSQPLNTILVLFSNLLFMFLTVFNSVLDSKRRN